MGWRTIYVEEGQRLSLYLSNLKIEDGSEVYTIPIEDIDVLLLDNYKMYLTVQLLCRLSQGNVGVIICNKKRLPELMVLPFSGNYAAYGLQERQLAWRDEEKALLWQAIVRGKISNQVAVLDKHSGDCNVLETMLTFRQEVAPDDSGNREGLAAKMYFRGLYGTEFLRDREEGDSINVALNYGYSLLRAAVARSIVAKGFIPTVGIHHHNRYNHFNLADDFMEPYRPLIDDWAYENMREELFTREKRLSLLACLNNRIILGGKKYTVLQSIPYYLDSLVHCLKEGDASLLQLPGGIIVEECE